MPKVLIALADLQLLDVLAFDLKGVGSEVLKSDNYMEALKLLEPGDITVVIAEQEIKSGEGKTLLQTIKEKDPHKPPVILVTPQAVRSMDELYAQGAEIVFQKPYNRRALIEALNHCIQKSEAGGTAAPRVEGDFEVKLVEAEEGSQKTFNLARGGMFIHCSPPMPPIGSHLDFEIQFKEDRVVRGSATVRWQRRYAEGEFPRGVGIEFQTLEPEDREFLSRLVNEMQIQAFIPKS